MFSHWLIWPSPSPSPSPSPLPFSLTLTPHLLPHHHTHPFPIYNLLGSKLSLRDKGVPHLNQPFRRGNHYVTVNVDIPSTLSDRQRELLEEFIAEGEPFSQQLTCTLILIRHLVLLISDHLPHHTQLPHPTLHYYSIHTHSILFLCSLSFSLPLSQYTETKHPSKASSSQNKTFITSPFILTLY